MMGALYLGATVDKVSIRERNGLFSVVLSEWVAGKRRQRIIPPASPAMRPSRWRPGSKAERVLRRPVHPT